MDDLTAVGVLLIGIGTVAGSIVTTNASTDTVFLLPSLAVIALGSIIVIRQKLQSYRQETG